MEAGHLPSASNKPSNAGQVPPVAAPAPPTLQCPFWVGQRFRLADGGDTNFVHFGPDGQTQSPVIVCVHGLQGCISSFEILIPCLLARGFQVLAYDLYGFGLSSAPRRRKLDLELYVGQLKGLLDALAGQLIWPVCILGHSMGGTIAVEFAVRYPQLVRKLLLTAPAGLLQRNETPCQPVLFGCLRRAWGCCLVGMAGCLTRCCGWYARRRISRSSNFMAPDVREPANFKFQMDINKARILQTLPRAVDSHLGVLRHMPLWEECFAHRFKAHASGPVPVLFLWGEQDHTVPWTECSYQFKAIYAKTGASCIMLDGAGHGLLLEDTEAVSQYAAAWFLESHHPDWIRCLQEWSLAGPRHQSLDECRAGVGSAETVGSAVAAV